MNQFRKLWDKRHPRPSAGRWSDKAQNQQLGIPLEKYLERVRNDYSGTPIASFFTGNELQLVTDFLEVAHQEGFPNSRGVKKEGGLETEWSRRAYILGALMVRGAKKDRHYLFVCDDDMLRVGTASTMKTTRTITKEFLWFEKRVDVFVDFGELAFGSVPERSKFMHGFYRAEPKDRDSRYLEYVYKLHPRSLQDTLEKHLLGEHIRVD